MAIIESKILDRQFTKLIWKGLKAGYFEFTIYSNNVAGTPQGSIISPILANIFLHQLDVHVDKLKSSFDIGVKTKMSPEATRFHTKITQAKSKGDMKLVKELAKARRLVPSGDFKDQGFKKLSYVRYADD
jgi:retron-type reverse transcriptase